MALTATELFRHRDMTLWANNRLTQRSKSSEPTVKSVTDLPVGA